MTCLLELVEKCCLELTLAVVVRLERLENFVQPFIEESPEVVKWPEVSHTFTNVSCIVVVGLDDARSVELRVTVSMLVI